MVEPTEDGFLTASLKIKVNSEELVHPLRELGITSSDLCIIFRNCWQVKTNFWYTTTPESIVTFEIEEESGLKQKLLSSGVGNRTRFIFRSQLLAGLS